MQKFASILIALAGLSACQQSPQKIASATIPSPIVQNQQGNFEITDLAPAVPGGDWKRKIKVLANDPASWTVEKRKVGQETFESVGFTDALGEYLDEDVSESAEYRFGELLNTGFLPALIDFVLQGTLSADLELNAYRVIVPKGQVVYAGSWDIKVKSEIFEIQGELRAFRQDEALGKDAGTLKVDTTQFLGNGFIQLDGMKGLPGAKGAQGAMGQPRANTSDLNDGGPGAPGYPGLCGQRGGAGAWIHISAKKVGNVLIQANGGPGGDGGPGGEGGLGGPVVAIDTSVVVRLGRIPSPGPRGAIGANGPQGPSGDDGFVNISRN